MTYKVFGILKRPDGMTFEQFKKWWLEVHVPRVMKWPGLVGYDVNFALNETSPSTALGSFVSTTRKLPRKSFRLSKGVARALPPLPSQAEMPFFSPRKLSSCRVKKPIRDS